MGIMAQDAAGRGKGVVLPAMTLKEAEDIHYLNRIVALFEEKRKLFGGQDGLPKNIMPETRNKPRVHLGYTEEDEEAHYRNKMMKLHEEKRQQIARQEALASQVKEREKVVKRRPMKKKQKQERPPIVSNEVTQRLKEFITDEMKGTDVKLVIQKPLYYSDLEKGQNRLNMPMKQVETHDFLTKDEKECLRNGGEFEVELLGPSLQMHEPGMKLKIWHLKSSDNYVLKTQWNKFVDANQDDLKEKTKIQVWSFRMENKLCFALACYDKVDDDQNDAAAPPIV